MTRPPVEIIKELLEQLNRSLDAKFGQPMRDYRVIGTEVTQLLASLRVSAERGGGKVLYRWAEDVRALLVLASTHVRISNAQTLEEAKQLSSQALDAAAGVIAQAIATDERTAS